jgi:hypothetical protein
MNRLGEFASREVRFRMAYIRRFSTMTTQRQCVRFACAQVNSAISRQMSVAKFKQDLSLHDGALPGKISNDPKSSVLQLGRLSRRQNFCIDDLHSL